MGLVDKCLACSEIAATALFTKMNIKKNKVYILKNGINTKDFRFNEEIRNSYRKKMNLEDKIVYGHVGNFTEPKNHDFLIDLFLKFKKNKKIAFFY